MKVVFQEMKPFRKSLLFLTIASIVASLSTMAIPMCMQQLIDEAIPDANFGLVFTATSKMLVFLALDFASGMIIIRSATAIAMGIGQNLRNKVFHKVQYFSQSQIDHFTTASLITRTNNDIKQVETFLAECLSFAISAPFLCIAGFIMAWFTSPKLSLVVGISIPVLVLAVVVIGKKAIPLSVSLQSQLDNINGVIGEQLTGVRVIRAFGTGEYEEARFKKINEQYCKTDSGLQLATNALRPVIVIVLSLSIAALIYMAYYGSVYQGENYSTGIVMSMIQYIMLILSSVVLFTIVFLLLPRALTAANRVEEILESESELSDPASPESTPAQKGYLTFENVSFSYKGADIPAVKNLSFSAKPGETTAIIGGTGSGKSTIVNLIPRLYDVSEGRVLIDGVDVRDYSMEELRDKIGFVPQKALLFKGTIESNIAFGGDHPSESEIEHAARVSQSYDFIMKKEDDFNSPVAQGGSNFSGGQKQRLCIARAIVRRPEIYVFDDSFSALDFKTDKTLRGELKKETGNATTVIVAQRIGTIKDADRIIVIDHGEIMGIGTHRELLKSCDVYREIAESQLSKEELEK